MIKECKCVLVCDECGKQSRNPVIRKHLGRIEFLFAKSWRIEYQHEFCSDKCLHAWIKKNPQQLYIPYAI